MMTKTKDNRPPILNNDYSETSIEQDFARCWKDLLGFAACSATLFTDMAYAFIANPSPSAQKVAIGIGVAAIAGGCFFGKRVFNKLCT